MKNWIAKIDAGLCFWFCSAKGFVSLIDQHMELDEMSHILTAERKAQAGWTDYQ